jgi:hypothetical protein
MNVYEVQYVTSHKMEIVHSEYEAEDEGDAVEQAMDDYYFHSLVSVELVCEIVEAPTTKELLEIVKNADHTKYREGFEERCKEYKKMNDEADRNMRPSQEFLNRQYTLYD